MSALILKTKEDVEKVFRDVRWIDRPSFDDVQITFSVHNQQNVRAYSKKIKRLFNDCGCGTGTFALVVAAMLFFKFQEFTQHGALYLIAKGFIIFISSGVAGKLAGLSFSYFKLRWVLGTLKNKMIQDEQITG